MKTFALKNPIIFSILLIIIFYVLMTCAYVIGEVLADFSNGRQLAQFIGKTAISALLIYIIWRFDWVKNSGVGRIGKLKTWLIVLVPGTFAVLSTTYAYTGTIKLPETMSGDSILIAANMISGGFVEELLFRGLIFYCFILLWSNKKAGLLKSGIISSVLFGASHLVWFLLGKDFNLALLQSLGAFGSGIFYAATVIQTRSIWPAVIIHGLTNAFVYIIISDIPDYYETVNNGTMDVMLGIPLIIYGLIVLMKYSKKAV